MISLERDNVTSPLRAVVRERVRATFREHFGTERLMIRSPGRINLIGEHTDYYGGFALPGAINRAIYMALRPTNRPEINLVSLDLGRSWHGRLRAVPGGAGRWPTYLLGIISVLLRLGHPLGGFDLVYGSDIPDGTGLSSSTALACGIVYALDRLFGLGLSRQQMPQIVQNVEQQYVGARCGRMDPMAILFGRANNVLQIDFRNYTSNLIAFPSREVDIVLCDSEVERVSTQERYNARRSQCEQGVAALRKHHATIRSLRDVDAPTLEAHKDELGPVAYRRCSYVIAENERVLRAVAVLQSGDLEELGRLMYAGHDGLRRQYEVSRKEVDLLVEAASRQRGTLGARMMGTGFGGCTINLVRTGETEAFLAAMSEVYRERLHVRERMYVCRLANGTEQVA